MNEYLNNLIDLIDGRSYTMLLRELNKIHFFPLLDLDNNRVSEIKTELRETIPSSPHTEYVTILEMLIWLAYMYEERAMKYGEPDHTATWFWCFIVNCNLNIYDDDYFKEHKEESINSIHKWATMFNNRTYGRDGTGSPFPLKHPYKDMRKIELFYQLNYYYDENK